MNPAQFLVDTSALALFLRDESEQFGWDRAAAAGLIAVCPVTELGGLELFRALFSWVPVDDRAYDRAWEVQGVLTERGQHRSAGPVDLIVAATAELQGLTLLHRDHDFDVIASVTGQAVQWYGKSDDR